MIEIISITGLLLSSFSCLLVLWNLHLFGRLSESSGLESVPPVSVLVPARDEECNIEKLLKSILNNKGAEFEVLVMDDGSTDRTAELVSRMARKDQRLNYYVHRNSNLSGLAKTTFVTN